MRIMLACNAGMSTSLVVAKMQDVAKAHGKDYKIWAVEQGEIQNELGNFDVLLLGPQVRFELARIQALLPDKPVEAIDMRAYGMMDGAAVIEQVKKVLGV